MLCIGAMSKRPREHFRHRLGCLSHYRPKGLKGHRGFKAGPLRNFTNCFLVKYPVAIASVQGGGGTTYAGDKLCGVHMVLVLQLCRVQNLCGHGGFH